MKRTIEFYNLGELSDPPAEINKDEINPVIQPESDFILIVASRIIDGKRKAGKITMGDMDYIEDPDSTFADFWNDEGLRREYLSSFRMCVQFTLQSIDGFERFSNREALFFDGIMDEVIPNLEDPMDLVEAGDRWVLVEFGQWLSGASFKVTAGNCADLDEFDFREEIAERLIYGFGQLDSHVQQLRKN